MGKLLDLEAERLVTQLYPRDDQGIIVGQQAQKINHHAKRALILIHGFSESPETYSEIISDLKNKTNMDIYAPLLLFHGRDLPTAAQLDNRVVLDDLKQSIQTLSKQYKVLTLVGLSYSGTLLIELASRQELPENIHLILVSPAIFIQSNTWFGRVSARIYGWWRHYCNYSVLGCDFPTYESGDQVAHKKFDEEKTLRYTIIPALRQVYELDLKNRDGLLKINRPYDLIVAEDDNRVDFKRQEIACKQNSQYCHFHPFPSGKHMIHWGGQKQKFERLLIKLAEEK